MCVLTSVGPLQVVDFFDNSLNYCNFPSVFFHFSFRNTPYLFDFHFELAKKECLKSPFYISFCPFAVITVHSSGAVNAS